MSARFPAQVFVEMTNFLLGETLQQHLKTTQSKDAFQPILVFFFIKYPNGLHAEAPLSYQDALLLQSKVTRGYQRDTHGGRPWPVQYELDTTKRASAVVGPPQPIRKLNCIS